MCLTPFEIHLESNQKVQWWQSGSSGPPLNLWKNLKKEKTRESKMEIERKEER
jgi:hypothetical protein